MNYERKKASQNMIGHKYEISKKDFTLKDFKFFKCSFTFFFLTYELVWGSFFLEIYQYAKTQNNLSVLLETLLTKKSCNSIDKIKSISNSWFAMSFSFILAFILAFHSYQQYHQHQSECIWTTFGIFHEFGQSWPWPFKTELNSR